MKALSVAGCYDHLDPANVACLEVILRRAQLIENHYREVALANDSKKSRSSGLTPESAVFMGAHRDYGDCMVSPQLLEYVAKEYEKDAAVLKSVRKSREERRLAGKAGSEAIPKSGGQPGGGG